MKGQNMINKRENRWLADKTPRPPSLHTHTQHSYTYMGRRGFMNFIADQCVWKRERRERGRRTS